MSRFYAGASAQQGRPFNRRVKQATPEERLASAERWLEKLQVAGFALPAIDRQEAIVARLREQAKKEA